MHSLTLKHKANSIFIYNCHRSHFEHFLSISYSRCLSCSLGAVTHSQTGGSNPTFSGREPWPQTWRCRLSSELLHTWLQTAPVHAEGHGLMNRTTSSCNSELPKVDTILPPAASWDPLHEDHKQNWQRTTGHKPSASPQNTCRLELPSARLSQFTLQTTHLGVPSTVMNHSMLKHRVCYGQSMTSTEVQ